MRSSLLALVIVGGMDLILLRDMSHSFRSFNLPTVRGTLAISFPGSFNFLSLEIFPTPAGIFLMTLFDMSTVSRMGVSSERSKNGA